MEPAGPTATELFLIEENYNAVRKENANYKYTADIVVKIIKMTNELVNYCEDNSLPIFNAYNTFHIISEYCLPPLEDPDITDIPDEYDSIITIDQEDTVYESI